LGHEVSGTGVGATVGEGLGLGVPGVVGLQPTTVKIDKMERATNTNHKLFFTYDTSFVTLFFSCARIWGELSLVSLSTGFLPSIKKEENDFPSFHPLDLRVDRSSYNPSGSFNYILRKGKKKVARGKRKTLFLRKFSADAVS